LEGKDVLRRCVRFMDADSQIGLAGTKLVNPDGTLQKSTARQYPGQKFARSEMDGLKGELAGVLGASMIARADLIRRIGGFDEDFVLYGEDQDLCLRIRKAGYRIGYIEDAIVLHYGGRSERQSIPAEVWKKKTRAEDLFYRKHYLPETVARIRRADRIKVRFRLFTLALAMPFLRNRAEAAGKRNKYRTIYETLKLGAGEGSH
jgi:N-acetylglucosaminyl-diphospho-decaprenol L-rhamnosyltransferase